MRSDVFEDAEVKEVVLAFYGGGLSVFFFVIDLIFEQIVRFLFIFAEDSGLDSLCFLFATLCTVHVALSRFLLGCYCQKALDLHIRQNFVRDKAVGDGKFAAGHVTLPREKKVVRGEHFELILDELFHPLDFI